MIVIFLLLAKDYETCKVNAFKTRHNMCPRVGICQLLLQNLIITSQKRLFTAVLKEGMSENESDNPFVLPTLHEYTLTF